MSVESARSGPLLSVTGLRLGIGSSRGVRDIVHGVSFGIARGETLALVGESGSGKTLTARALIRLLPTGVGITGGRVEFDGTDLTAAPPSVLRHLRGARIGFVFQEPSAALSPVYSIGDQVREALLSLGQLTRHEASRRATDLLEEVGFPDAARRARDFPHQLSGGLRQRAMLAIALAGDPCLLVADEPTTALDALLQADILDLLHELRARRGLAVLLITHDLGIVAQTAHRVAVMYAGRIVEEAPTSALLATPRHPYTRGLLASVPGRTPGARLAAMASLPDADRQLDAPGCAFAPRCPRGVEQCSSAVPWHTVGTGHVVQCHVPSESSSC